jgi:hypothetical protein
LKNLQIEERPGQTTSGLTSANQLVDMADAVSFDPSNTSSAIVEIVYEVPKPAKVPECITPRDNFRNALRDSVRREKEALDILAKL